MRLLWLLASALHAALVSALTEIDTSPTDFITEIDTVQNTTAPVTIATSNRTTVGFAVIAGSSNVTIGPVQQSLGATIVNETATVLNVTNNNIDFQQDGFRFIGRTIAGTNLGPNQHSAATLLREVLRYGLAEAFPSAITEAGPFYDLQSRAKFVFPPQSSRWSKAALTRAARALQRYFEQNPTTQKVQMSISSSGGALCSLTLSDVRIHKLSFQYADREVTQRSNKIDLNAWDDGELDKAAATDAMISLKEWIESQPQRGLIDPGTVKIIRAGNVDMTLKVSDLRGDTADITWAEFLLGFQATCEQLIRLVGADAVATLQVTFQDFRGRRQVGFWLRAVSARIMPGPRPSA